MNIKKQVEEIGNRAAEEKLKELPRIANNMIHSAFLSLLGLEQRSNSVEIDHCNGRYNLLSDVLKMEAQEEVRKAIKEISKSFDLARFKEAFQKEFMTHIHYYLKYEGERLAKLRAEEYCKKHLEKFMEKILSEEEIKGSAKK